jgi:hypothetical protein
MGKSVMGNAVNAESRFLRTEEHETEAIARKPGFDS